MENRHLEVQATHLPVNAENYKDLRMQWRVTLLYQGKEVLSTDFHAGVGACPSYKAGAFLSVDYVEALKFECKTGHASVGSFGLKGKPIMPKPADVLYSLLMESDTMDYCNFEDWAASLGYDQDSRKAERVYRACLDTALKLRAALGDALLKELREAFQDY